MPLNKLENFLKNTEGRILYVNPSDLDSTDSISNQGNSLSKPFKTIQRAILESARFSYLRGSNNDITEKTTILLFPGEHLIDNRPGFAIKNTSGTAKAVSPSGAETIALDTFGLNLNSNFDLTQSDNILYKFNSVYGGVIVPRGTSLVSFDLRKTKIRPKYIPNPTDFAVKNSSIFRITGACYFWQLSFFDGDETNFVYTDPTDFSSNNQSAPLFSHHKLTCFEYADGVNSVNNYDLTDLDMYYAKLSNAYGTSTGRNIDQKYPSQSGGFAKQRPEWEIVGAFASDPVNITSIISGDGATPSNLVTVTTSVPHNLQAGTPIKIRGVNIDDYNISTKVQSVDIDDPTLFTYVLPFVRTNLPAGPDAGLSGASATVTIETDTVGGASPYIFNCSLRSVWGMNGMHSDGSKASGFRSMVVAQFTGVSLQKDDRAFVRYNPQSRTYDNIAITKQTGADLSANSSSTNLSTVYHLDSNAIYRNGWESSHIKITNDAFIQIVSVFAIGFNKHFDVRSGGDASITNSNSNFGQFSLSSDGFKKESFDKDDRGYITNLISPRAITNNEIDIDWTSFDVQKTKTVGISSHLYLFGYNNEDIKPPILIQGYRIGAKANETIYLETLSGTKTAKVYMVNNISSNISFGTNSAEKLYSVSSITNSIVSLNSDHGLKSGEKIRIISETGDLPENLVENTVYYAIANDNDGSLSTNEVRIASSKTNSQSNTPVSISIYGGEQLKLISCVADKNPGDIGSPIQWDSTNSAWYVHVNAGNEIYSAIQSLTEDRTLISYIKRKEDSRGLDEKIYKFRYVIPKELINSRDPVVGFILQESSSTSARNNLDFTLTSIGSSDFNYNRNQKLISTCSFNALTNKVTVISETDHGLNVGDKVIIKNVTDSINTAGTINKGYNGTFIVTDIDNAKTFRYSSTDVNGISHSIGSFTNNTSNRTVALPRFEKNDNQGNFYIYRSQVITPYIENIQDGVYHLYVLNSSNAINQEFTNNEYSQNVVNLYPQLDRDNVEENPNSTKSFAKRSPLGEVNTNRIKNSITRETVDKFLTYSNIFPKIVGITTSNGSATITFDREHSLSGIVTFSSLTGGSGHTNSGTFYNVKLFNTNGSPSTAPWNGATAKVTVAGGSVTSVDIQESGSGYSSGDTLYINSAIIGGTPNARITINSSGISSSTGCYGQVTGIGTTSSGYYIIQSVPSKTQISVAVTTGEYYPTVGQYFVFNGPTTIITSNTFDSTNQLITIVTQKPHGLVTGNRFRLLDISNNNLGEFIVNEKTDYRTFNFYSSSSISSANKILKNIISGNEATSDSYGENLESRGIFIYNKESLLLKADIAYETALRVELLSSGETSILKRFPLGSYIKIDSEIMRITSSTLSGAGNDQISVIRGAMGTLAVPHTANSLIRKIKLLPIEFRRPSILRASGHTFEYLGYGPGNYSTALPQVQTKTLSEREDFLAQSQETSSGKVIYTGMNSNGDSFVGNTKVSASSGQQITFGIPIPSITGQDPSRLSVVYDEVLVKERIIVEGGNSGTVLSQFNGPLTLNKELKTNDTITANGSIKLNNTLQITNSNESNNVLTGCLVAFGGVGIGKNLRTGGSIIGSQNLSIAGITTLSSSLNVTGNTTLTGTLTANSSSTLNSLSVTNDTLFGRNILVSGISTFNSSLIVNSSATLSSLSVTNSTTLNGNLTVNNTSVINSTLYVSGATTLNSTLNVTGNTLISGELNVVGDIAAYYQASDKNWKNNIKPIEDALSKVLSISGNTFEWNEQSNYTGKDVGVIAQELKHVLPEAVVERDDGHLSVSYQKIIPLLIEAIKDLKQEIEKIKTKG